MLRLTVNACCQACNKFPGLRVGYVAASTAVVRYGSISKSFRRQNSTVPFRKQLKEEAKLRKAQGVAPNNRGLAVRDDTSWKLTVGIEIHAQLNSDTKLFSGAPTFNSNEPNTHTALFDLAIPGSQPILQKAVLLPALRAATALNCKIQKESRFDRKHYFYQDQPSGYQITQYYAPLAKDGHIILGMADGIAPEDGPELKIGIKQVQLEQDTAKSIVRPPQEVLLDFNRVGHPLIEIITLPQIHSPQTAAACVRKVQDILESVNAVTTGMELGGLRADVNISVQRKSDTGKHSYAGVEGLGQRTEIKNLSSFKAVEDAIVAEKNRQIEVLESGQQVEGETRGWSLGSTETRKLRGKEGEVDYRYMPDPDIPPLILSQELIEHVQNTLPMLPDEQIAYLQKSYGINSDDAKALVSLDRGLRLDFLDQILDILNKTGSSNPDLGRVASNWILHELGGLLKTSAMSFEDNPISAQQLADILQHLDSGKINGQGAKHLLSMLFVSNSTRSDTSRTSSANLSQDVGKLIIEHDLAARDVADDIYVSAAEALLKEHPEKAQDMRDGRMGKLHWFIGQMLRQSQGKMDPKIAAETLRRLLKQGRSDDS